MIDSPQTLRAIIFLTSVACFSQTFRATLTGRALDPSGAVVPNARVEVTSGATGIRQQAQTNGEGAYTFPLPPSGRYTVQGSAQRSATVIIDSVVLEAGSRTVGAGTIGSVIFSSYIILKIANDLRPAGSSAPLGLLFGEFITVRDPRIIQVAVKLYF